MPELVPMPKLGFDMAEGTLVRQVKKAGDAVKKGEVLAEIETDKATVEVEAPADGVVKGWVVEEGTPVPVGALMAVIGAPDEQVDLGALREHSQSAPGGAATKVEAADVSQGGAMGKVAPPQKPEARAPRGADGKNGAPAPAVPSAQPPAPPAPAPASQAPAAEGEAAPVTPVARRMASDAGIDIRRVRGSGPGGRVTKRDVEEYLRAPQPEQPAAAPERPAPAPVAVSREDQAVPLTRMRSIIARRMTESAQTVPQFYVTSEVDMAPAMALRKELNALLPEDQRISVNDFVVKAAALALREFPNVNAAFAGDKVVRKGHVNVGIAVAVEAGLLTVVVKDADVKSLGQSAVEARAMALRAREGRVQGADIEGSTFSVSNLGMFDVHDFIAIVNPPEAAILAIGSVLDVPVVKDGAVVPGQRMQMSISADHRVTDGAEAARFLQALKKKLEEPLRLLL